MKAIICTKYGPPEVLQPQEVEKPVPKNNEVLIKILATDVTASDCIVRGFKIPAWHPMGLMMGLALGFGKPRKPILGLVLAGEVESSGRSVKRFTKGDQVFAFTNLHFGAYAQYTCLPEKSVMALKPSNMTYEEAAAIPYGGMIALHYLKRGNIQKGQKVLIYGASGAIGTAAIQLARHYGAEVGGVCSTTNLEMVRSLGAQTVIDYTRDDFTKGSQRYDFILDAVGKKKSQALASAERCKNILTANGIYLSVDDGSPRLGVENLIMVKELAEAGELKPVIDRCYPLEQMAEAHRYVDQGHKKGNVVIAVGHDDAGSKAVPVTPNEMSIS
jgi:NADPH:quinone reductase-like Zn-dependent oxidoreductase